LVIKGENKLHYAKSNLYNIECLSKQESRADARKPCDAGSVLSGWSSPTTFTTSI